MIVSKQQALAIAGGRKTTHRTPNTALKVGHRQAVSYRESGTLHTVCYIEATAAELGQLGELTRAQAKAEGFDGVRGPANHRRAWLEEHDRDWMAQTKQTDEGASDEVIAQRFQRLAGRDITVLTLKLVEAPDMFMAPSSGRLTKNQTTTNPRRAIDDAAVPPQEYVDAEARRINQQAASTLAQARREAAAENLARALRTGRNSKQINNAVRAVERITASIDRNQADAT